MQIKDLPPKYQRQINNKYHAQKTEVDGITFDSKKESERYAELKILAKAGEIYNLTLQPRFLLQEPFVCDGKKERKIEYVADFMYFDKNGQAVVEDVKGKKTDVYQLKRKLFLYQYKDKVKFREV